MKIVYVVRAFKIKKIIYSIEKKKPDRIFSKKYLTLWQNEEETNKKHTE